MACQAMHMWSLSGLVAAFLDLAIAYLLLCGSAVAYLASKFLGFLGLNLPCPCDGLFLNIPSEEYCLNRVLVDFPAQKVASVQFSVKQKFPFNDSVWGMRGQNYVPEVEGEGSCSSVSDGRMSRNGVLREMNGKEEKYDLKGKGVSDHRPRSRLRLRRKGGGGGGRGKYSSISSYDRSLNEDNEKASTMMGVSERSLSSAEMHHYPDEDMHVKNVMSIEELQDHHHGVQNFRGDDKGTIRILEQALEEERIARAALYIELEKERSAAASAADEAMAMILRLQEEKASIEMEARQYQRIIDEKSAYDAEEMNIFKEILLRREMEKHFLEKEVEAYRQMVSLENEQLAGDDSDNDDPIMMLHQLNASHEKEMISSDNNSYSTPKGPIECSLFDDNTPLERKEGNQIEETNGDHDLLEKTIVTCNGTERNSNYGLNLDQQAKDELFDNDSKVHDVHVVGDQANFYCKDNVSESEHPSVVKMGNVTTDCPSTSRLDSEVNVVRSSSDITVGLPPVGPKGKSSLSDLRRSSMSAVDSEMLKIDCEVGKLRERLKIVQEGREKLSLTVESRERESIQLKLLEDIARQIQEIRDLNEPGKAARQISLPLPNSKSLSKRRRCRSVSSGFQ